MATEGFRPKEALTGFSIVDNTIGPTIEYVLHISFGGTYPSLVLLDAGANLRLFSKHPVLDSISSVFGRFRDFSGEYESRYDACFVYPEHRNTTTAIHEYLHGWLTRQNAAFAMSEEEQIQVMRRDPEQMIAAYACAEGLAEFGVVNFLRGIEQRNEAEEIERELLYGDPYAMPVVISERTQMQHAYAVLEKGVTKLTKINTRRIYFRKIHELLTTIKFEKMFYSTGYYFCRTVVEGLIRSGMRFEEAYTLLAQHIPTTINELKNPDQYSAKLLELSGSRTS